MLDRRAIEFSHARGNHVSPQNECYVPGIKLRMRRNLIPCARNPEPGVLCASSSDRRGRPESEKELTLKWSVCQDQTISGINSRFMKENPPLIMTDIFCSQLEPVGGWHDLEIDPATNEHFRWTEKGFSLKRHTERDRSVFCLDLLSYFPSDEATLEIRKNGRTIETLRPRQGRRRYFVHMSGTDHEQSSMKLELHANREVPTEEKPGDSR